MQNDKLAYLYSTPLQAAHLGRPYCLRVTSDQKRALNKLFLEFCFRSGLFYAKLAYLYLNPIRQPLWGGPTASGCPRIKKCNKTKSY
jgi:hypothetical protein